MREKFLIIFTRDWIFEKTMMKDVFGKGTLVSVTLQLHWNDNTQLSSHGFMQKFLQ